MNKKGIFVSLTAALILGVIVFMIVLQGQESAQRSELNVQYSKHKYAADYIEDVEEVYLPALIAISEKYAMYGISDYINSTGPIAGLSFNITQTVLTGKIDSYVRVMPDRYTLPYLRDQTFDTVFSPIEFEYFYFNVTGIGHRDNVTLRINSTVNMSVKSEYVKWRNVINYSTDISVNALVHPVEELRITNKWVVNDTKPCYIQTLDPSVACSALTYGLCPLGGCS